MSLIEVLWLEYPILSTYQELNPEYNAFYDSHGNRHLGESNFIKAQLTIYRRDKIRKLMAM